MEGERTERDEQAQHAAQAERAEQESASQAQMFPPPTVPEHDAAVAAPVESVVRTPALEVQASAVTTEPVTVAEAQAAPVIDVEPEPAPALVEPALVEPARIEPARIEPAMPAPSVDIERALQESGLVMIKTDPSKVRPIEPVAETPAVQPRPRPRRAPPPDTGPLQIVETRKDA